MRLHRQALESTRVSAQLHDWIDLTFGCKLIGKAAHEAKNVPLGQTADAPSSCGFALLFSSPHPPRGCVRCAASVVEALMPRHDTHGHTTARALAHSTFPVDARNSGTNASVSQRGGEGGSDLPGAHPAAAVASEVAARPLGRGDDGPAVALSAGASQVKEQDRLHADAKPAGPRGAVGVQKQPTSGLLSRQNSSLLSAAKTAGKSVGLSVVDLLRGTSSRSNQVALPLKPLPPKSLPAIFLALS